MNVVRSITGYTMSRDYPLLWTLAQRQSVVCVSDYGDNNCRDVCQTIHTDGCLLLSVRGCNYITVDNIEDFVAQCARWNIEFIVPERV